MNSVPNNIVTLKYFGNSSISRKNDNKNITLRPRKSEREMATRTLIVTRKVWVSKGLLSNGVNSKMGRCSGCRTWSLVDEATEKTGNSSGVWERREKWRVDEEERENGGERECRKWSDEWESVVEVAMDSSDRVVWIVELMYMFTIKQVFDIAFDFFLLKYSLYFYLFIFFVWTS